MITNKVAIIDYGLGNTFSLLNAMKKIGVYSELIASPDELFDFSHIILPGVGAFPYAKEALEKNKMDLALIEHVKKGRPLLGICLGMQLLFEYSLENKKTKGLNIFPGYVERFEKINNYRIPHIQWNIVNNIGQKQIMDEKENSKYFYFIHSYYKKVDYANQFSEIGITSYADKDFVSFARIDNVIGTQFHPEKSGKNGLKILLNFLKIKGN